MFLCNSYKNVLREYLWKFSSIILIRRMKNFVQAFDCVWQPFTMHKDKSKGTNLIWRTVCLYSWFMFFISFHFIGKWFFFLLCALWWLSTSTYNLNSLNAAKMSFGKCGEHTRKYKAFKWRICGMRLTSRLAVATSGRRASICCLAFHFQWKWTLARYEFFASTRSNRLQN